MASVMSMHWAEVSKAQYEEVRKSINMEGSPPPGLKLHVAWFAQDGMHVLDLWDSPQDFDRFFEKTLGPAIRDARIEGKPESTLTEAHNVFMPKS